MAILATADNLRARYIGTIPAEQDTIAETLLDDAYALIVDQLPTLPTRLDADPTGTLSNKVIRAQCAMVGRVFSNPDGLLQETIDDYSYRRDSAVSTGKLYLAEDEYNSLTPSPVRRRTAFSIHPA